MIKRIAESRIGKLPSCAATLLLTASVLASPLARPLLAQERPNASPASLGDRWEFLVAPYLLFPYMSGTTTIRGIEAEVDANPGDIFSRLQFGAMLFFEAHNSVWAASLDGLYMNLSQPGPLGLTEVGLKQGMVELTGYRRVMPGLEVLAGGRLNVLSGDIEILPIEPLPPEGRSPRRSVTPRPGSIPSSVLGRRCRPVAGGCSSSGEMSAGSGSGRTSRHSSTQRSRTASQGCSAWRSPTACSAWTIRPEVGPTPSGTT